MRQKRGCLLLMVLAALLGLMAFGLWILRSRPLEGPAIVPTRATPAPGRGFVAENGAFRLLLPPDWYPLGHQRGWWWFVAQEQPLETDDDEEGEPRGQEAAFAPTDLSPTQRLEALRRAPAVLALSYAPEGDLRRLPQDAVYRWLADVEGWFPWAVTPSPPQAGNGGPPFEARARTVGDAAYPAVEVDLQWALPRKTLQGRLVLVEAEGQVWAFLAYATPEAWARAEEALRWALDSFVPSESPPPPRPRP